MCAHIHDACLVIYSLVHRFICRYALQPYHQVVPATRRKASGYSATWNPNLEPCLVLPKSQALGLQGTALLGMNFLFAPRSKPFGATLIRELSTGGLPLKAACKRRRKGRVPKGTGHVLDKPHGESPQHTGPQNAPPVSVSVCVS